MIILGFILLGMGLILLLASVFVASASRDYELASLLSRLSSVICLVALVIFVVNLVSIYT